MAISQDRTVGRTRDPGPARSAAIVATPTSASDGSRDIGRTRLPESVSSPVSTGARDVGRPRTSPPATTPVAEAEPLPKPRRPPHGHVLPNITIVDDKQCESGTEIGGSIAPEPIEGFWIRKGVHFGRDVTLSDLNVMPEYSGYDFSDLLKRSFNNPFTDMYFEVDSGNPLMKVREDTEIMDLGNVLLPVDAIFVPRKAWSQEHSAGLIAGHEYVVWTWDHRYAKFLVRGLLNNRVIFDWAYQDGITDIDNASAMQLSGLRYGRSTR